MPLKRLKNLTTKGTKMDILNLVKKLEEIRDEHGDLPVTTGGVPFGEEFNNVTAMDEKGLDISANNTKPTHVFLS